MAVSYHLQCLSSLAREQALGRPLAVGWEKEGELATTSLEFDNLHQKVDAKSWLSEMTLVMMSLPLACVFQCLFTVVLISASRWLAEIWQLSRRGDTGELEVELKIPAPQPECPEELACRLPHSLFTRFIKETNTSNDSNSSLNKLWKTLGRRYSLHECWQSKWYLMTNLHCCTVMHLSNGILSLHSGWKF